MTENELKDLSLPAEEARLAEDLRRMASELQPDAGFQAGLEKKLMNIAKPGAGKPAPQKPKNHWIPVLSWVALAAVLIVGLSVVLSTFLPRGITPAASPVVPIASQPAVSPATDTPAAATIPATEAVLNPTQPPSQPVELPSPTPPGPTYVLSQRPDQDFHLAAEFPASPSEVAIYRQVAPPALTIDNARAVAQKLGINGEVYVAPYGAPDETSYRVQEGERYVIFFNSPQFYMYDAHSSASNVSATCQPPCISPEGNGAMMKFLNQRGLIDFPATSQLSGYLPQVEQLVQLIDGMPLVYSPGTTEGDATISSSGEVMTLNMNPMKYEPVTRLPILTAQQAWDQAVNSQLINGMDMSEMIYSDSDLLSWYRQHPLDQRVELFGWISSFKAAEQGKPPLILLDGYPVTGSTQGMESVAPSNSFAQVWGTFKADNSGGRRLEVEGWQLSPFPSESITGTIMLRGDATYVLTNGRLLRLPDAPSDLPLDTPLFMNGVVLEFARADYRMVQHFQFSRWRGRRRRQPVAGGLSGRRQQPGAYCRANASAARPDRAAPGRRPGQAAGLHPPVHRWLDHGGGDVLSQSGSGTAARRHLLPGRSRDRRN